MALPAKPNMAGSSVRAAMSTMRTAAMQAMASPIMYAWPMR